MDENENTFVTADDDLTLLLSLAADAGAGTHNHDTAMLMMQVLERVENRLLPQAPTDAIQTAAAQALQTQFAAGAIKLLFTGNKVFNAILAANAQDRINQRNQEGKTHD